MNRVERVYEILLASPHDTVPALVTSTVLDDTANGRRSRPCTVIISWAAEAIEETAHSVYHAFQQARVLLEQRGLVPLCQGSRPLVQVSGMLVDMGDGTSAYDLENQTPGERPPLVCIFDSARPHEVAPVAEQRAWVERQRQSIG